MVSGKNTAGPNRGVCSCVKNPCSRETRVHLGKWHRTSLGCGWELMQLPWRREESDWQAHPLIKLSLLNEEGCNVGTPGETRTQDWEAEPQRERGCQQKVCCRWLKDVLMDGEGGEMEGCGFQHAHQMALIYEEIRERPGSRATGITPLGRWSLWLQQTHDAGKESWEVTPKGCWEWEILQCKVDMFMSLDSKRKTVCFHMDCRALWETVGE